MPRFSFRMRNRLRPLLPTKTTDGPFEFEVPSGEELMSVKVVISLGGHTITASLVCDISEQLASELEASTPIQELSQPLETEVTDVLQTLSRACDWVLRLVEQELRRPEFHSRHDGMNEYSLDGTKWHRVVGGHLIAGISVRPNFKLDTEWVSRIQTLLKDGERPLIGTLHLQEAYRAQGERFQWMEATIAAELAIKEILIRLEPRLASLLLELPSPPLPKLYGPILKDISGKRSPYLKELQKGVEVRNRLVHRPEPEPLDTQQVINYIRTVEDAIRDLLRRQPHRGNADS